MIELNHAQRCFKTENIETLALNNISLNVAKGEFLAVMGPSGCGKSTLLSIIGMLDSLDGGIYRFDGADVTNYSENKRAQFRNNSLGYIFQNFNLIDELTVFENVALPLRYQNVSESELKERVEQMLKKVGIDHRAGHLPLQLSGGQQQRVAVARALVINPKLILADEPTGNLDSNNGEQIMSILRELNSEGTTIIMVTHSEQDANYASRVIRLLDGNLHMDNSKAILQEVSYV